MKTRYLLALLLFPLSLTAADYNTVILQQIAAMPRGGGYSVSHTATQNLQSAVTTQGGQLEVNAARAQPSYCSGATYLLFLKTLSTLAQQKQITLSPEALAALRIKGQRDGEGVWGRWNANGPGTAVLFSELNLGKNFTSFAQAKPGDFMKVFWNDSIGRHEHGHSVVYLGMEKKDGVDYVRYWSSNKTPGGYAEKSVPASKIILANFSRLENPQNISKAATLPAVDSYLASMLVRDSTLAEAKQKANIQ
ncbi:MAG: hypothetical protein ABI615_13460 [Chthoniobacterales bacterium]